MDKPNFEETKMEIPKVELYEFVDHFDPYTGELIETLDDYFVDEEGNIYMIPF